MTTTKEIIDYVMNSPENTNPAILRELLSEHGGAGGSGILMVDCQQTDDHTYVLDKTWQEIKDAGLCVIHGSYVANGEAVEEWYEWVVNVGSDGVTLLELAKQYFVAIRGDIVYFSTGSPVYFTADSANAYPTFTSA